MRAVDYLPSKQFSFIALSLILSIGLVYTADAFTKPPHGGSVAVDTKTVVNTNSNSNWQASLDAVQAQSGTSLPAAPDQNVVNGLLQAAQSSNLTDTISRTLLVNITNAKQQGLGDDIPTQTQIVNTAMSQINATASPKNYTAADLDVVTTTSASQHDYGNAVMSLLIQNSNGEYAKTMMIIDDVTSKNDGTELVQLPALQKKYQLIAKGLAALPVPKTLEPFHLELVNDYQNLAASYTAMQTLISDPIGGLAGLQQYNTLTQDAGQMFINIAQQFDKNGILFNKDEPGATWGILLQAQQQ